MFCFYNFFYKCILQFCLNGAILVRNKIFVMFSKQINFMQGETYRYIAYIFVYRSYLPFRNNFTGLGACIIWNCLLYIVFPLSIEPHKQYGKKIYKEYQSNTRNLNMTQNDFFICYDSREGMFILFLHRSRCWIWLTSTWPTNVTTKLTLPF